MRSPYELGVTSDSHKCGSINYRQKTDRRLLAAHGYQLNPPPIVPFDAAQQIARSAKNPTQSSIGDSKPFALVLPGHVTPRNQHEFPTPPLTRQLKRVCAYSAADFLARLNLHLPLGMHCYRVSSEIDVMMIYPATIRAHRQKYRQSHKLLKSLALFLLLAAGENCFNTILTTTGDPAYSADQVEQVQFADGI